ncbi:MAG TPA: PQQ-dependent sugar dehydrogenase [Candidatus Obscuribacterales bacterium]
MTWAVVIAAAVLLGAAIENWFSAWSAARDMDATVKSVKLPPGFQISVYARVPGARQIVLSPKGTLFVGSRTNAAPHLPFQPEGGGVVYAVTDTKNGGTGGAVIPLTHGLNFPNGVEFKDGALYIAEISRILRYDNIEKNLKSPPKPAVVNDSFPDKQWHGWKYIRFGPDGWLYVPVGAPCNACLQDDPRFASIMRIKQDGSKPEIYAKGIRNTVGFDWDPKTHDLWFTDNGRDYMGDNAPPDELNHAPKAGMNFGFPYCHGKGIPDPEFGKAHSCSQFTPAAVELGPHHAALGMKFYTGSMFPKEYRGDIFIAEHGSWNSSKKVGYQIARVHFDKGQPVSYEPFATGFLLPGERVWGRPVDVLVAHDGALLVSDDFAGAIYRISYSKN